MPILFAGTSIADVLPIAGTSQATTAIAWLPPSGFVAEGITATSTTAIFRAEFAAPATEFWASCWVFSNTVSYTANTILLKFGSPSGGDEFALRVPSSGLNVRFDYNNAGAWTQIAPAFAFDNSRCRIDLYYKRDAINGRLQLYRDGVLVFNFTGNTAWTAAPALTRFDMGATSGNGSTWSAIIVHTQDTRKLEFVQLRPNGDGAETAWIGDYTAVDETGYSDTDIIASNVAGQVETFLFPDLPSGYDTHSVTGVVLGMRAQGSGSPGEIRGVARIGGVDYEQAPVSPLQPAWGPHKVVFENNPASSARWTQAQINAAEFGVKSV
ncbi:hypothetical protein GOC13_07125 [Sinorhizobium meliloti]|nr:hypothetical protein [Sinorhizobium meliloti]